MDDVIIKHKLFKDVCCRVIRHYNNEYLIEWINLGTEVSYPLGVQQVIKIDNISDWELCLGPERKCLRYATWADLEERYLPRTGIG